MLQLAKAPCRLSPHQGGGTGQETGPLDQPPGRARRLGVGSERYLPPGGCHSGPERPRPGRSEARGCRQLHGSSLDDRSGVDQVVRQHIQGGEAMGQPRAFRAAARWRASAVPTPVSTVVVRTMAAPPMARLARRCVASRPPRAMGLRTRTSADPTRSAQWAAASSFTSSSRAMGMPQIWRRRPSPSGPRATAAAPRTPAAL